MLDAGALIAFERNDRRMRSLVELALAHGGVLHVPAGVLAQVWRNGQRQARLARLIGSEVVAVHPLDRHDAQAAGVLCGESGSVDVVDASVVLLARRSGSIVVTSDPDDLRRFDPNLPITLV